VQLLVDLVHLPEKLGEVLRPLEVRDDHAAEMIRESDGLAPRLLEEARGIGADVAEPVDDGARPVAASNMLILAGGIGSSSSR
jgi:hypothetical protein